MKILLVIKNYFPMDRPSGVVSVTNVFIRALRMAGHDVSVACVSNGGKGVFYHPEGWKIFSVGLLDFNALADIGHKYSVDKVIAVSSISSGVSLFIWWGLMLRRFKQDTVFYQATNFKTNWFQARVIKQVLSGCASVIGANEYISSLLGKAGLLTSVVLPGVMVEDFRLLLSSDEIKVPGKDVVFMGHLSEIKGADVVVSLARNLTHRTFSFVAGYSSRKKDVLFYNKVKLEIDDLPNASHVAMVPNPLEYLRVCKVMVLPYRSGDSVLGVAQSAIEAMLMGIPVVSTSNAALSSLLVDGVNGYICSSYDEMLEAIERLLDDNALYSKFSEEAKKTALTNHDALKNINGFLK